MCCEGQATFSASTSAATSASMPSMRISVSAQRAKMPLASQPYHTNGQWNGTAKISSVIHRLWPHSFIATCIISVTDAAISSANDHGKPFSTP